MEKLTVNSFFSNYILHPLEAPKEDRKKAVIATIVCGIFSLGICQLASAIYRHYVHIKNPTNIEEKTAKAAEKIANSAAKKELKEIREKYPVKITVQNNEGEQKTHKVKWKEVYFVEEDEEENEEILPQNNSDSNPTVFTNQNAETPKEEIKKDQNIDLEKFEDRYKAHAEIFNVIKEVVHYFKKTESPTTVETKNEIEDKITEDSILLEPQKEIETEAKIVIEEEKTSNFNETKNKTEEDSIENDILERANDDSEEESKIKDEYESAVKSLWKKSIEVGNETRKESQKEYTLINDAFKQKYGQIDQEFKKAVSSNDEEQQQAWDKLQKENIKNYKKQNQETKEKYEKIAASNLQDQLSQLKEIENSFKKILVKAHQNKIDVKSISNDIIEPKFESEEEIKIKEEHDIALKNLQEEIQNSETNERDQFKKEGKEIYKAFEEKRNNINKQLKAPQDSKNKLRQNTLKEMLTKNEEAYDKQAKELEEKYFEKVKSIKKKKKTQWQTIENKFTERLEAVRQNKSK